jgi:hypothetical protein
MLYASATGREAVTGALLPSLELALADPTVTEAVDAIYASMKENNKELDIHIAALKAAMAREGVQEAMFEPAKLAQNNRQGRKLMQSYFRKKCVAVSFSG